MPTGHFQHPVQVGFRDTDASGWMHFPNVFCFVEEAECAYLRQLGVMVYDRALGGWPRVNVSCQYHAPLVAWDPITVLLRLQKVGNSSLHWEFDVVRDKDRVIAAAGSMITVRVDANGRKIPIPVDDRVRLDAAAAGFATPMKEPGHGK